MKKIISIHFNWFFSPAENSQGFDAWVVGQLGVTQILHVDTYDARGFYAVHFENGTEEWIYNVNRVFAEKAEASPLTDEIPF